MRSPARGGLLLIAALALCMTFAPAASAAPRAPSDLLMYALFNTPDGMMIGASGTVTSPKPKCLNNRTVRYTQFNGPVGKVMDVAKSSREGAFAFLVPAASFTSIDGEAIKLLPRTIRKANGKKKLICAGKLIATGDGESLSERAERGTQPFVLRGSSRAATPSKLGILGIDGADMDAALYGRVTAKKSQCVSGRRVALYSITDGRKKQIDLARSGRSGAWAGHIAVDDVSAGSRLVAVLKRKKYKLRGGKRKAAKKKVCGGARTALDVIVTRSSGDDAQR